MSKGIFVVMEQRYGKVQNVGLELAVSLFHYYENTFTHCRVSSLYF